MIIWPEELPCMLLGSTSEPVDPQLRTPMQNGRTFVRRGFTAVPENFAARWILDDDQASIFEAFYWETLQAGTLWFNMPVWLPQIKGDRSVQFQGAFTRRQLVGGTACVTWEYSANMQHYLAFKSAAPEPPPVGEEFRWSEIQW